MTNDPLIDRKLLTDHELSVVATALALIPHGFVASPRTSPSARPWPTAVRRKHGARDG